MPSRTSRYARYSPRQRRRRLLADRSVRFPNDVLFLDHIRQGDLEQVGRFIRARKVALDTIHPSGECLPDQRRVCGVSGQGLGPDPSRPVLRRPGRPARSRALWKPGVREAAGQIRRRHPPAGRDRVDAPAHRLQRRLPRHSQVRGSGQGLRPPGAPGRGLPEGGPGRTARNPRSFSGLLPALLPSPEQTRKIGLCFWRIRFPPLHPSWKN